jgi:hypothetical protein
MTAIIAFSHTDASYITMTREKMRRRLPTANTGIVNERESGSPWHTLRDHCVQPGILLLGISSSGSLNFSKSTQRVP